MYTNTVRRTLLIISSYTFLCVVSLNIEELKPVNYEVEIVPVPMRKGEEVKRPVVTMTSIYGQEYQCLLPQIDDEELSEKESPSEKVTDILELLSPLKTSSCLLKGKDWWTYEFCYGHYIKQFHIEDGRILGQVLTLGIFESDYDWNNETDKDKFKNSKQRYHSQMYVNGTNCDLTGQQRNAEVRFFCEEGVSDYIHRVDEPGTCSYVISIHTSRLCSHPQLKPPPSQKAHAIPCHPVLSEEQYTKFLQKEKEEKELAEQKRTEWLSKQHERLQVMKNDLDKMADDPDLKLKLVKEYLINEKDGTKLDTTTEDSPVKNNVEDKEEDKKETPNDIQKMAEVGQTVEKVMEKLKNLPERFQRVKNNIKDILVLTDADEGMNLAWMKDSQDSEEKKVTATLKTLLEKLERAGDEVAEATKTMSKVKSTITSKDDEEDDDSDSDDSFITKPKLKEIEDSFSEDSDQLTVRIRKLDRRKSDPSGQLYEMDSEQKEKLEQAVKEKLAKAGLDTGGRKIEVKIINGYYDNDGTNELQPLADDETGQFQNMIMALLFGQKEALQEMERHKKMEDNYKYSWEENED